MTGIIMKSKRWNTDRIEYFIDKTLDKISWRSNISSALNQIDDVVTCLSFQHLHKKPADLYARELLLFEYTGHGCYSHVGKQHGRPTRINLDPNLGCLDIVTIKHEVIHSIGFVHEHQRPDRDSFVRILSDKISTDLQKSNIENIKDSDPYRLYTPYDYFSIMHYSSVQDGVTVMEPYIDFYKDVIRYQKDLSPGDEVALNLHFKCPTIRTSVFSEYMRFYDRSIYHELAQLEIVESEASRRSYLLNPHRIFVSLYGKIENLLPHLAGEYLSVHGKSLWQHSTMANVRLEYIDGHQRWLLYENRLGAGLRSKPTKKILPSANTEWEFYDFNNTQWIPLVRFGQVYVNIFMEHDVDEAHEPTCNKGWLDYGGEYCYKFSQIPMSWPESHQVFCIILKYLSTYNFNSQFCHSHNGIMAEIRNNEEEQILDVNLPKSGYWLGLTDGLVEGQWRWHSDSAPLDYSNWTVNEPNNGANWWKTTPENCVCKYVKSNDPLHRWNDQHCLDRYAWDHTKALCQQKKIHI